MTKEMNHQHRQQLEEMKRQLSIIGFKESNFLKIELLFYDAIEIARAYGNDLNENKLLARLKELQANEYQNTKHLFKKSSQREQVIRRFITGFRSALSAGIKTLSISSQPTSK
jgi:hypothetical protein